MQGHGVRVPILVQGLLKIGLFKRFIYLFLISLFVYIYVFTERGERGREREKQREGEKYLPSAGLHLKWLQQPELGLLEARVQEVS